MPRSKELLFVCSTLCAAVLFFSQTLIAQNGDPSADKPAALTEDKLFHIRGRIDWVSEIIERLHGVKTKPEAAEGTIALETAEGEVYPILEDSRGIAFRKDERLHEGEYELLVRRHKGSPFVQIVRMYQIRQERLYEVDYWCTICAIAMYERKPCDCCQAETELRFRLVKEEQDASPRSSESK